MSKFNCSSPEVSETLNRISIENGIDVDILQDFFLVAEAFDETDSANWKRIILEAVEEEKGYDTRIQPVDGIVFRPFNDMIESTKEVIAQEFPDIKPDNLEYEAINSIAQELADTAVYIDGCAFLEDIECELR